MLRYLSPAWFDAIDEHLVDRQHTDLFETRWLTVGYVVLPATSGRPRFHTQVFRGAELVEWHGGLREDPDLVVRRDCATDRGDLLSRLPPDMVARGTSLRSAGVSRGDVFGVGCESGLRVTPPSGLTIAVELKSADAPFGSTAATYALDADGFRAEVVGQPDIRIDGPYANVLRWLHDERTLLGSFIVCPDLRTSVEGDFFKMSALEGCISAAHEVDTTTHADLLVEYARCRNHCSFRALTDELDAITAA